MMLALSYNEHYRTYLRLCLVPDDYWDIKSILCYILSEKDAIGTYRDTGALPKPAKTSGQHVKDSNMHDRERLEPHRKVVVIIG
jgi:hypothetical protein